MRMSVGTMKFLMNFIIFDKIAEYDKVYNENKVGLLSENR